MKQFTVRTLFFATAFVAVSLALTSHFQATTNWGNYAVWDAVANVWRKREFSATETWFSSLGPGVGYTAVFFLFLIAVRETFRVFSVRED